MLDAQTSHTLITTLHTVSGIALIVIVTLAILYWALHTPRR